MQNTHTLPKLGKLARSGLRGWQLSGRWCSRNPRVGKSRLIDLWLGVQDTARPAGESNCLGQPKCRLVRRAEGQAGRDRTNSLQNEGARISHVYSMLGACTMMTSALQRTETERRGNLERESL